jgi:hypothetical protein
MNFTFTELQACAAREVKQRKRVYARRVQQREMTQEFADRETAMMQAIADHFDELAKGERLL